MKIYIECNINYTTQLYQNQVLKLLKKMLSYHIITIEEYIKVEAQFSDILNLKLSEYE